MDFMHIWHVKIRWSSCTWSWCISSSICLMDISKVGFHGLKVENVVLFFYEGSCFLYRCMGWV